VRKCLGMSRRVVGAREKSSGGMGNTVPTH